jgi:hypothetical protein
MYATLRVPTLMIIGSIALAGCSNSSDFFNMGGSGEVTTQSLAQTAQKVDPACGNLAVEIDTLRREGVADKVEKAAAKKYKMTAADLNKASQLNRANGEFQAKCSTLPRTAATPIAAPPVSTAAAPAKAAMASVGTN